MSGVVTHNANKIKNLIETAAVKRITHPQVSKVYVNVSYGFLTWIHCDPTADLSSDITYRPFPVAQNEALEGIPRKAHQVLATNLQKFSIKSTRTFNLARCVVNDHKTQFVFKLKYDFIITCIVKSTTHVGNLTLNKYIILSCQKCYIITQALVAQSAVYQSENGGVVISR